MNIIDLSDHRPENIIDFIKAKEGIREKKLSQRHNTGVTSETPEQVEDFINKYRERHNKE